MTVLQFNVSRKIEKMFEIWSLQIVRKRISLAMMRLNVFIWLVDC
jgi:hypothetical protein